MILVSDDDLVDMETSRLKSIRLGLEIEKVPVDDLSERLPKQERLPKDISHENSVDLNTMIMSLMIWKWWTDDRTYLIVFHVNWSLRKTRDVGISRGVSHKARLVVLVFEIRNRWLETTLLLLLVTLPGRLTDHIALLSLKNLNHCNGTLMGVLER